MAKMETSVPILQRWERNNKPERQTAQLLHLAGLQLHDIYEELPNPDPVADNEDQYQVCIR